MPRGQGATCPRVLTWGPLLLIALTALYALLVSAWMWARHVWPSAAIGVVAELVGAALLALPWVLPSPLWAQREPHERVAAAQAKVRRCTRALLMWAPLLYFIGLSIWADAIDMARVGGR